MIKNILCSASISGDFCASTIMIPSQLKIIFSSNKGEVINKGKFLGQIALESRLIISGELDRVLDFKNANFSHLIEDGKVNIILTITVKWHTQCNFELNHEQLKKIADLKIACGISCYSEEE